MSDALTGVLAWSVPLVLVALAVAWVMPDLGEAGIGEMAQGRIEQMATDLEA